MTAPSELRVSKDRKTLFVTFPGAEPIELPAEMLRVLSPSAEVQGHSPEQRVTVPGKREVAITRIDPVGNYAVRITFDDFHDTGIFTWIYLAELGLSGRTRREGAFSRQEIIEIIDYQYVEIDYSRFQ
jgi:DUF971 family protein